MASSGPTDAIELTIVMPCLNEARTLPVCIAKAQEAIRAHGIAAEIVVADNGSTDGSVEIAQRLGARVVPVAQRGYGAALAAGIQAARGQYVLMGDADDSYDFGEAPAFLAKLREGADLVMGCRLPSGGGTILPGAMPWKHRWIGNPTLSAVGRFFFRAKVKDFYCGLRAFRRDFVLALDLRTTGMEFALEMVIKSHLAQGRIAEVPITLSPDGRGRAPHLRTWSDGWRSIRFMMLMSPRWLFLVPGVALMLAGAISAGFLIAGPVRIGRAGFDTSTLLVACMVLTLGIQIVIYAFFSRMFAVTERLLPPDPLLNRITRVFTLESGLMAGAALALGGTALLIYSAFQWRSEGFGSLNYSQSQRIIIPAVTAMVIGVQVIFSSFFLSILGLSRR